MENESPGCAFWLDGPIDMTRKFEVGELDGHELEY